MQRACVKQAVWAATAVVALGWGVAEPASAASEWLAVCSKCVSPGIFSKTGIGTSNAVAQARITPADVKEWCDNWQPGDGSCVKNQLAAEDLKKVYRASANCTAGSITPIDGRTYTLAGAWDGSDIGAGRSRWRDASGKVVGRDNASGGLGIAQQWEILCPQGAKGMKAAAAAAGSAPKAAAPAGKPVVPAVAVDEFAVGQTVLARYGSEWVRARVNAIRHRDGPKGPQTSYDVSLENGKRGSVPARMLRKAP